MSSENIYAAPQAGLDAPEIAVPEDILKKIKTGWVAGVISAVLTMVVTGLVMAGANIGGVTAWSAVDAVMILALAFGIYKKSRVCAVIMLVYFVAAKIFLISETGKFDGIVLAIVFTICYFQAVVGTFGYHRFIKDTGVL